MLPDTILPADSYLLIWADKDTTQGALHANFKISKKGERLQLLQQVDDTTLVLVNSIMVPSLADDESCGRKN